MKLNKILLAGFFVSLVFGELQRLPGLPVYAHDLLLAVLLAVNRRSLKFYRPAGYFLAAGLVSLVAAGFSLPLSQVLAGSLYLARFGFYSLLFGFKVPRQWLIAVSSGIAGFGLCQYFLVPDTRFLLALNFDEHYYRLLSSLFDPNFTALILVLGLVQIFYYRPKAWALYGLHFFALLLTYSRSGYAALLAAAVSLAVIKKNFKLLLMTVFILLILLPFLPRPGGEGVKLERTASINQRLENYSLGFKLWRKSPVFGLGFNTLRYFRDNQASHSASGLDSSLLLVLVTTGVIGLAAYLYLLKSLWARGPAVKTVLAVFLVNSLFINSLFYGFALIWLWSVVDG